MVLRKVLKNLADKINSEIVKHDQLGSLLFGQQNYGNHRFFLGLYGQSHTVPLEKFPHLDFIKNYKHANKRDNLYQQYLKHSWKYLYGDVAEERYADKIQDFIRLYEEIESRRHRGHKAFKKPIILCVRPDGKKLIVSGNHRASVAHCLGLDIGAKTISARQHLLQISLVDEEFYGSARMNMPYQSIYDGSQELVRGRRPDIYERIMMMNQNDIKDKVVMDLGCNIGSNCYVAAQRGAKRTLGIDYSPRLISVALRLNSYYALPCDFIVLDLNDPLPDAMEMCDTAFCFSVVKHLKCRNNLYRSILDKTKSVLYFEGHAHTAKKDYDALLNKTYFESIDLIGYTRNGIHNHKKERPLFRCQIR